MTPAIPGLRYIPDFIESDVHDRLWAAADTGRWLTGADYPGTAVSRRVQIYGYSYEHRSRSTYRIGELPAWGSEMAERLWCSGLTPMCSNQVVVNDYPPGSGIFEHVDAELFGDSVVSLSLGSTCVMQFKERHTTATEELLLEPRSALVLSEAARYEWTHRIWPRTSDVWLGKDIPRSRRISITFRSVPQD